MESQNINKTGSVVIGAPAPDGEKTRLFNN